LIGNILECNKQDCAHPTRHATTQLTSPDMKRTTLSRIDVHAMPGDPTRGWLTAGAVRLPCRLGRGGVGSLKREGDGRTPRGSHALLQVFYRADRLPRPRTGLRLRPLRPDDGWCDAPFHQLYNRPVRLPFAASHEDMWRADHVYDCVVDIGWNRGSLDRPAIRGGAGSAIFMHLTRPEPAPTAGCVALRRSHLLWLLARLGPRTRLHIC
jgi:L,D-peptidoglycan transpeptidase YkuD (ErfK/YbiS/YcfS/YnhG family)